jgi:hypothetical protein
MEGLQCKYITTSLFNILLFLSCIDPLECVIQPPIQLVSGVFSFVIKRPERVPDHSNSYRTEIKNGGSYLHSPNIFPWLQG